MITKYQNYCNNFSDFNVLQIWFQVNFQTWPPQANVREKADFKPALNNPKQYNMWD